uniref:Fucose-1-phosphate guanylyltransferase n=1 Tax=Eptatretus burgeri TaxID=7764 RepID=A0A8C4R4G6_EPTBU
MDGDLSSLLTAATARKLKKYDSLRGCRFTRGQFWDVVVLTASDEKQAECYKHQMEVKRKRQEFPLGVSFHVFADPPGPKIGDGGSVLFTLSELDKLYGKQLESKHILLIIAGGYSQRLPSATVLGKLFMALPMGERAYQMLDLKLAMYIEFPLWFGPGVFVSCSDDIEVYDASQLTMPGANGIVALAHPSPLHVGTMHGVYVLNRDAGMQVCKRFLHKPTIDEMHKAGAVLQDLTSNPDEFVYTDSVYHISLSTSKTLKMIYAQLNPLDCEVDAYGDFLQGLGTEVDLGDMKVTKNISRVSDRLIQVKKHILCCLKGTPLHVLPLDRSKFYHLGTLHEYLYHFTRDDNFRNELGIVSNSFSSSKPDTVAQSSCVIHSLVNGSVKTGSVVEYSILGQEVVVGENCVISGISLNERAIIPNNTFLHTVSVSKNETSAFVTIFLGISDDVKKSVSSLQEFSALTMLGRALSFNLQIWNLDLSDDLFTNPGCGRSLWNARLFPMCETMELSAATSLKMVAAACEGKKVDICRDWEHLSLADVLQRKDDKMMLAHREQLVEALGTKVV